MPGLQHSNNISHVYLHAANLAVALHDRLPVVYHVAPYRLLVGMLTAWYMCHGRGRNAQLELAEVVLGIVGWMRFVSWIIWWFTN